MAFAACVVAIIGIVKHYEHIKARRIRHGEESMHPRKLKVSPAFEMSTCHMTPGEISASDAADVQNLEATNTQMEDGTIEITQDVVIPIEGEPPPEADLHASTA